MITNSAVCATAAATPVTVFQRFASGSPPFTAHLPSAQTKGRALLPRACEDLRAAGFAAATLTTGPGTRAERFYRENGWEETGRKDDGEIIFRKPL